MALFDTPWGKALSSLLSHPFSLLHFIKCFDNKVATFCHWGWRSRTFHFSWLLTLMEDVPHCIWWMLQHKSCAVDNRKRRLCSAMAGRPWMVLLFLVTRDIVSRQQQISFHHSGVAFSKAGNRILQQQCLSSQVKYFKDPYWSFCNTSIGRGLPSTLAGLWVSV